jgi:class 3 adenylate cyclase
VANLDLLGRTARAASAARKLNQNPQLLAVLARTRERWLGDDQVADRVSSSRRRPADIAARELGALRGEQPGVLGEFGLIVVQAWQNLAEHQGRGRGDVDVAILFTDLVGYSSWALRAGDESAITLLGAVGDAIEPPIVERRGEVVKRLGDGLMAVFWDASGATEAAFEARERLSMVEVSGYRPELRTGIHLGRPRRIRGDYFGIDVNIAARLAEAAKPREVLLSERALHTLAGVDVVAGRRRLDAKGTPAGLTAYAVEPPVKTPVRPGRGRG